MHFFLLLFLFICVLFQPHPAAALKLRNLDDKAHTVAIESDGEASTVTLEPGDIYRTLGRSIIMQLGEQQVRAMSQQEWAIFDGELSIQRRNQDRGSRR